jgi:hypothetical protein
MSKAAGTVVAMKPTGQNENSCTYHENRAEVGAGAVFEDLSAALFGVRRKIDAQRSADPHDESKGCGPKPASRLLINHDVD